MRKQSFILGLIIGLLPIIGMTQVLNQQSSVLLTQGSSTLTVKRGQSITQNQLAAIADITSARDEKGNPVVLSENSYEVGSFTRATISIAPPGGKADDVITLDLLKPK